MTDGSDGDDGQPSGSDAAPESSDGDATPDADDSVTPGVDADEASEPPTPASTTASAGEESTATNANENSPTAGVDEESTASVDEESTATSADGGTTEDDGGGFEKVPDDEWENRATPGGERSGRDHRDSQSAEAEDRPTGDEGRPAEDDGQSVEGDTDGEAPTDTTGSRETTGEGDSEPQTGADPDATGAPTADELDPTASTDRDLTGVADERLPDGVTDERASSDESETTDEEPSTDEELSTDESSTDKEPSTDESSTDEEPSTSDERGSLDDDEDAPLAEDALVDTPTEERAQQTDGDRGHASTVQPEAAFDARAGMEAGTGTEAEPTADAAPATPAAEAEPDTIPAAEAGTGTVGEGGTVGEPGAGVVEEGDDGLFGGDGPESDEEMPLTEHIEEMMRRLGAVFAVGGVVTLGVLVAGNLVPAVPNAEEIITFLWDAHVDFDNYRPYVYGPLELLLTKLKVAGLAGVVIALPVFVYQTYRFMRPGLYPHERRYYLAAVPTSLVLAVVGVAFAHFLVLPAIFQYFISYTEASANLAFGLRETFNLILLLMGYMAIVFQIPLFIQLSIMMGVVTREWLEQRRLLFWGSFLGLSFLVSPDPTGMSPIIVATTMVVLFEGTLALLRWTGN